MVVFPMIYNHKGYTEYLLLSDQYNLQIRIECKWQQTSGSVDENLPYVYLSNIEAMPEHGIMILIDGSGWKAGSIIWLKNAVANKKIHYCRIPAKKYKGVWTYRATHLG
jgi:hypothetical protein